MQKVLLLAIAFTITLTISCRKKTGCTDKCAKNYINAKSDDGSCEYVKPVIDYAYFYSNNCKPPYGVTFNTEVSNVSCDVKYEWTFGDGATSNDEDPYHVFTSSGTYTITVKAINGSEEGSKTITVVLDTLQAVKASLGSAFQSTSHRVPCDVRFYNYSNYASDYLWDFGDGNTSTQVAPTHTYYTANTYTVKLTVGCGGKQSVATQTITVLPEPSWIILTSFRVTKGAQPLSADKGTPLYMEMLYNNNSKMFSNNYLYKSYPAAWSFPGDQYSGNYKVNDLFFNNDNFTFKLWLDEISVNDRLLYTANVDYDWIKTNHYPEKVTWDSGGYGIEAFLDYQ